MLFQLPQLHLWTKTSYQLVKTEVIDYLLFLKVTKLSFGAPPTYRLHLTGHLSLQFMNIQL